MSTRHGVDLNLIHAVHFVLDWVFECHDIDRVIFDFFDQGVEARRFTATSRTTGKHHAVWPFDAFFNRAQRT